MPLLKPIYHKMFVKIHYWKRGEKLAVDRLIDSLEYNGPHPLVKGANAPKINLINDLNHDGIQCESNMNA